MSHTHLSEVWALFKIKYNGSHVCFPCFWLFCFEKPRAVQFVLLTDTFYCSDQQKTTRVGGHREDLLQKFHLSLQTLSFIIFKARLNFWSGKVSISRKFLSFSILVTTQEVRSTSFPEKQGQQYKLLKVFNHP